MTRRLFLKFFLSMGALFFLPKKIYSYEENRILLLSSVVAGFRYYDGEKIWKKLSKNDTLELRREPTNPHDRNAIEIYWNKIKLGYVPKADNSVIAQLIDRGNRLNAYITWLKEDENPWKRIGINIELLV